MSIRAIILCCGTMEHNVKLLMKAYGISYIPYILYCSETITKRYNAFNEAI